MSLFSLLPSWLVIYGSQFSSDVMHSHTCCSFYIYLPSNICFLILPFLGLPGFLYPRRVYRDLSVHMYVCSYSNGVTALQASFLNRLSRSLTHMFTNVITCTSSSFGLLWSKTRSKSNLTNILAPPLYRLYFLSDCHEIPHTCLQTS